MASTAISAAQAEIINSLTQDEIPAKLRCAMCSKLAVNAFRLPCCEQAICENCQSTLPSSCPVCEHSPLSADDCTPHKSLRTTIKVFLRTEEKKREGSRAKAPTPATPIQADIAPQLPTPNTDAPSVSAGNTLEPGKADEKLEASAIPEGDCHNAGNDSSTQDRHASAEPDHKALDGHVAASTADTADGQVVPKEEGGEQANAESSGETKEADADVEEIEGDQQNQVIPGAGVNSANGSSFPNANMNFGAGNFDQMQMMMAMQNGMAPNAFGAFPMMGMPGMSMDPMAMQNMYMNGGFGAQGMGMNGMNMNMGMGGFGGGPNNNWNNGGQQSWNVGPDNLNYQSASGMGSGDYGSFNSGFQTGYNQGNYGPGNQFNNYRQNQFAGFRGRGRGRGAYGQFGYNRGGYNQTMGGGYGNSGYQEQQNHMAQQQHQQSELNGQSLDNESGAPEDGNNMGESKADGVAVDEFGRELRVQESTETADGGATERTDASKSGQQEDGGDGKGPHDIPLHGAPPQNGTGLGLNGSNGENMAPYDDAFASHNGHGAPGFAGPGFNRGTSQPYQNGSRSGSLQPIPTPAPDVPLNAPKGPKALLRGLPNTSILHLKARGLTQDDAPRPNGHVYGGGVHNPALNAGVHSGGNSPADYSRRKDGDYSHHQHSHDHDRSRDHSKGHDGRDYGDREHDRHDRDRSRSPGSRSRTKSRSRSRDRKEKDSHRSRRRRHRSESVVSDHEEDRGEDGSRSKRHRSRKYRDDVEDGDPKAAPSKDEEAGDEQQRSTSIPPDDAGKSSRHRSSRKDRDGEKRRDKDRDRDRDRDRERDRDRDHDRDRDRKSHRSHRERDYDRRDRDRDRDRERDKDKDRERKDRHRRDRDREHRHRSSKRTSAEPEAEEANPSTTGPTGSSRGLEIKGASSRSRHEGNPSERRRSSATTGAAALDPHAAERAARDRERLLKETRRMASLGHLVAGGNKRARGGDDAGDDGRRSSSRRKGRRGEVVDVDDDEERMRRLEAEREAARFRDD